jgi:hypothetical protein
MAKVQIFRQSKTPVRHEDLQAYHLAFQGFYDKAAERAKADMYKMERFLRYGERQLIKHYNKSVIVALPTSAKQWKTLCATYGYPVMAAQRSDNGKMVLIIMDDIG